MQVFHDVSIVLPTLKETDSILSVIDEILNTVDAKDIKEFIFVVCEKTKKESFFYIKKAEKTAKEKGIQTVIIYQKLPFFGGAVREGFMEAKGSHVCMVTPDGDTAPDKLCEMVAMAKKYPGDVIAATRWKKGGGFENYGKVKKIWNYLSQKFLGVLYFTSLSDFTWGNQLAPAKLYQAIDFHELKHPVNMERVAVPLRLGIKFHEVAAVCRMPVDDVTVNPFWANMEYLRPALKLRFTPKSRLLKKGIDYRKLKKELTG